MIVVMKRLTKKRPSSLFLLFLLRLLRLPPALLAAARAANIKSKKEIKAGASKKKSITNSTNSLDQYLKKQDAHKDDDSSIPLPVLFPPPPIHFQSSSNNNRNKRQLRLESCFRYTNLPPPQSSVLLKIADRTTSPSTITTYTYPHNPHPFLPIAIQPNFLPLPLLSHLLPELMQERHRMKPRLRKIGRNVIEGPCLTNVVREGFEDDNSESTTALLESPHFQEARRMVEEYVNVHKSEWWRQRRLRGMRAEEGKEESNSHLQTDTDDTQQRELETEEWRGTFWVHNIYRSRHDSVAPHGDELQVLGVLPIVAGLSFGASRIFRLNPLKKHIIHNEIVGLGLGQGQGQGLNSSGKIDTKIDYDFYLPSNCLYVMTPGCQEEYHHSVPEPKQKEDFLIHPQTGEVRLIVTFRHNKWGVKDVPRFKCGEPMNMHYFHGLAHGHTHNTHTHPQSVGTGGGGYFYHCNWTAPNIEKPCHMKVPFFDPRRGKGRREEE